MRQARVVLLAVPLLLAAGCGSKAPPPAGTPATPSLAAAPAGRAPSAAPPARGRTPWQNSRFFGPKQPAPVPLLSRPKRPIRGPAVHTLRS